MKKMKILILIQIVVFFSACSSLEKRIFNSAVKDYPSSVFEIWILNHDEPNLSIKSRLHINKQTLVNQTFGLSLLDVDEFLNTLNESKKLYCLSNAELSNLITSFYKSYLEIKRLK